MIIIGILLEIVAAALGTISKQLIAISQHLKKPWLFHIGASINILVGPVVDASAYAFAPQVIVAPFACLDVIFNALTAPYTLKWQNEVLTRVHFLGCGCVTLGASLTSVLADADNEVLNVYQLEAQLLRPASIIYFSIELFFILVANFLLRKGLMSAMVRGIALGVIAGLLMGNVFFVKGIVGLIRHSIDTGDVDAWFRVTPYACIACAAGGAIVGHMFMRKGLGEYKGVFMVTIFEGAHISAACLSGCIVMSEMAGAPWWRYCCYWASVGLIVAGMLFINSAAADAQMGRDGHIARSFVREKDEEAGLKDGVAPAPIGRKFSEENLMGDGTDFGFGNPLGWDSSPIREARDVEMHSKTEAEDGSPRVRKSKCEGGETSSNVSTSTPEEDVIKAGNGDSNGKEPPVFRGS